jgi:hypothetical protein
MVWWGGVVNYKLHLYDKNKICIFEFTLVNDIETTFSNKKNLTP